ncbi:hypothetical protein TNCV_2446621 [Trichonephila clavipes]|nr:hypothetical protein TNCV_2446621 [Trichonephila clavipes]
MNFGMHVSFVELKSIRSGLTEIDSQRRSSVSWPQKLWLQAFPWPLSNQHTAIAGTNAEPAFIRNHHTPSSNELLLDTTGVGGLESVEYTLQGVWPGAVLEVTDF